MTARRTAAFLLAALVALPAPSPAAAGPRDPYEIAFALLDTVDGLVTDCERGGCGVTPDDAICTTFAALAPGVEPVVFNSQGDVFVAGEPFWDCPPYDLFDGAAPADDAGRCHESDCLDPLYFYLCTVGPVASPGLPPYVEITPEGDYYVAGERVWDCPPYDFLP